MDGELPRLCAQCQTLTTESPKARCEKCYFTYKPGEYSWSQDCEMYFFFSLPSALRCSKRVGTEYSGLQRKMFGSQRPLGRGRSPSHTQCTEAQKRWVWRTSFVILCAYRCNYQRIFKKAWRSLRLRSMSSVVQCKCRSTKNQEPILPLWPSLMIITFHPSARSGLRIMLVI